MKTKLLNFFLIILLLTACKEQQSTDTAAAVIEPNLAVIIGDVVNIRETPSVNGKIISQLNDGDKVKILSASGGAVQVGKFSDKWFKIETKKNISGYVFGAFLFELDELFRGLRWNYVTYSEWAFGLKFKRNGKVTFVYAFRDINQAEYEYEIQGNKIILKGMKANFIPMTLYFFRYQGKNYLTKTKSPLESAFSNEIEMNQTLFSNRNSGMENFINNFRQPSN